jgi:hypothetical protein
MLQPFTARNQSKPYRDQEKPCNFLLTAFVAPLGYQPGVDVEHFHLVAPYEADPREWMNRAWASLYDVTGRRDEITTAWSDFIALRSVLVKEYRAHAETKSLAPDGAVCGGTTTGLVRRRPVTAR